MKKVFYMFLTICLVSNAFGLTKYTYQMTEAHMLGLIQDSNTSHYISPTISGDESKALNDTNDLLKNYVVGTTLGNNPSDPESYPCFQDDPKYLHCPPHNLYGYKIYDPCTTGPKVNIVIIAGIHGSESSGTWACHGMEDFFASNEPEAINLRRIANIFVYPLCNPDGRYLSQRGSPELGRRIADGEIPDGMEDNDMNRVWHLYSLGVSFSNTDALVPAMIADTGGEADYFLDFHGGNQNDASFIYIVPSLYQSQFIMEFDKLNPYVPGEESMVHVSSTFRPGDYRMTRVWAMRPAPVGLNARIGCTPENTGIGTEDDRKNLGRLYGQAIYNTIVAEMAEEEMFQLQQLAENWLSDQRLSN